jgi:hypothetical protein
MDQIDREIAAYDRMQSDLEAHHMHKFIIIKDEELRGAFDTLDNVADFARRTFGKGPYLIRQVGKSFA